MDDVRYAYEYTYTALTGNKYRPFVFKGKWYIGSMQVSLSELSLLLNLDEAEMIMLRLKYGG